MPDSHSTPVYRKINGNRLVEILDHGSTRSLYFGGRYLQSRMSLAAPQELLLPYTHYMMFSLLLLGAPRRVLLIGLGAGSLVSYLHHHFPDCLIDAVDNSAEIIKLARGYFRLPASSRVRVYFRDGTEFLRDRSVMARYDLILLDAFDEAGMSAQVYAGPSYRCCREALAPGGLLCCNLWSGGPKRVAELVSELKAEFPEILQLPVPERGNVICIGGAGKPDWRRICRAKKELSRLQERFRLDFPQMVRLAMRHNLSLGQRLLRLLFF